MKNAYSYLKLLALASVIFLAGCAPDSVSPNEGDDNGKPTLAGSIGEHPSFGPECSERVSYQLMDENGGTEVSYFGPFGIPPVSPSSWGSIDLVNSDVDLAIEINMAFGWAIDFGQSYFGPESGINMTNGIPVVGGSWIYSDVPEKNNEQLIIPISSIQTLPNSTCFDFAIRLSVVQLDFLSGVNEASRTTLWVRNNFWNDPTNSTNTSNAVNNFCLGSCGPVVTTLTGGNCSGCNSENTVVFYDCDSVDVSSCKDLSNVVLLFVDNTFQKFDGLSNKTGSFAGTGANAGKDIARCYVKSGCFKSGDGPGWGLRFDSPCNDDNLITVPGTGGGGNGKNK